ncbi:conserved hypothetical protein [delta proteobacterium NaphS2]|nr:conserved hypothetical protein [delta proteobacterium NaphS2]
MITKLTNKWISARGQDRLRHLWKRQDPEEFSLKEEDILSYQRDFRRYLQEIAEVHGKQVYEYWNEFISKGKLPSYEWLVNQIFIASELKDGRRDRHRYDRFEAPCNVLDIFQFLSQEFIKHVAESIERMNAQRIIEIGAGDGFLTFFLKRNINIHATDNFSRPFIKHQEHVEKIGHKEALEKYNPDLVVINWEEYEGTYSIDVLDYPSVKYMLWIGEPEGCTGSDDLWEFDCLDTKNPYCLSRVDYWNFGDEIVKKTGVFIFYPTKTGKNPWSEEDEEEWVNAEDVRHFISYLHLD